MNPGSDASNNSQDLLNFEQYLELLKVLHMLPSDEDKEDEESLKHLNQRARDLWMVTIEDGEETISPNALLAHLYKISGAQFTCEEL